MCKLNILCKQADGKCNCSQKSTIVAENQSQYNGLLCSILAYIKDQPDIMRALSESNKVPVDDMTSSVIDMNPTITLRESPPTEYSSLEEGDELSINLLSSLPSKITLGRGFSLMAEIVDKNFLRVPLTKPLIFQVLLIGKNDNQEKALLAEVETTGVALFKKLVIDENIPDCLLSIRIKENPKIASKSLKIKFKPKKDKDLLMKKVKSEEVV